MIYPSTINSFNILLADDDKDDCLLFEDALEELPLAAQLKCVYNGEQLMQLLNRQGEQLPDMLFLDLNMPRKNGIECLAEIKHNPHLQHLPVIIYSTSSQQGIINLLYKNGAQLYICKPSSFSELKDLIRNAISLTREAAFTQLPREKFVLL